jgi:hypothetical protein
VLEYKPSALVEPLTDDAKWKEFIDAIEPPAQIIETDEWKRIAMEENAEENERQHAANGGANDEEDEERIPFE